ncbi:MAG: PaaI family thioesterase [Proteobacteria bacterium]|nr:PaaI family thioesterase [Pseudomonadota bacterium]
MQIVDQIQEIFKDLLPGHLGFEIVSADPQEVVGRLVVGDALCTTGGILHGGSSMALADTLGAVGTFLNLPPGARTSTVESKTNFVGAARLGQTVVGACTLKHKGRTMMLWQTELRTTEGKLVALVSQSQIVMRDG